jgi:putative membrane protein
MDNKKILILAVDVDDDVSKIGVKTPVVGRESVLDAALKLALTTPEDTDVNAIFGAIKQFDKLKSEGFSDIEIALVSGSTSGGVEADLRIREEVSELAQKLKPSGTIFVSDGGEDERVIPIVQSVIPLFSVQRVTVQYSKNIEETYRVLASYIRKGLTEPRLVKYTLGLPGVLILVVAILAVFGFIKYVAYFAAFLLGIVLTLYTKAGKATQYT